VVYNEKNKPGINTIFFLNYTIRHKDNLWPNFQSIWLKRNNCSCDMQSYEFRVHNYFSSINNLL